MAWSLKQSLADRGITRIEPGARTKLGLLLRREGVRKTSELKRILSLPRRRWSEEEIERLRDEMTELLKEPEGTMRLNALQAVALYEAGTFGGLAAPIAVGGGKTLISFLAPTVLEAERPLLMIPASLRDKTEREFRALERHWWGRRKEIKIVHYEAISRENGMQILKDCNPDLIIADECHRLKNPRAAVTKRVIRWMEEHPRTKFVAMSGTFTSRSLKDFAHILEWCLPKHCPLPQQWNVLVEWCQAVDEKVTTRMAPGALEELYNEEERRQARVDELAAVRSAVRRRITETPGVVASGDARLGASLRIAPVTAEYPAEIDQMFWRMRQLWETPHGEPIADPVAMWRHTQELALGFVYRWDPPPPPEWLEARKIWAAYCRHILSHNQKELDSELPVMNAVRRGEYDGKLLYRNGFPIGPDPVDVVLKRWLAIKPSFKPRTVPVWYHEVALNVAKKWMKKAPGIVWVEHNAFGERLAEETGAPFFRGKGREWKSKTEIELWKPENGSIIVSRGANDEGRNLQAWHRSLVMAPPSQGKIWEQLLGRTHREGQEADEVVYDVYFGCVEMLDAFRQALDDSRYIESGQQTQKLNYADVLVDFDSKEFAQGPRWVKSVI